MIPVEQLLAHLIGAFALVPLARGAGDAVVDVVVSGLNIDLPIEMRVTDEGSLLASLPRGVMATGFEPQLGRLRIHCEERQ